MIVLIHTELAQEAGSSLGRRAHLNISLREGDSKKASTRFNYGETRLWASADSSKPNRERSLSISGNKCFFLGSHSNRPGCLLQQRLLHIHPCSKHFVATIVYHGVTEGLPGPVTNPSFQNQEAPARHLSTHQPPQAESFPPLQPLQQSSSQ